MVIFPFTLVASMCRIAGDFLRIKETSGLNMVGSWLARGHRRRTSIRLVANIVVRVTKVGQDLDFGRRGFV